MSDRISWIDDAKMFAMFCVVFGHVSGLFSNKLVGFYPINTAIVSFNMPLFVFLSGYTASRSINKVESFGSLWNYFKKVGLRILVPALTFSSLAWLYTMDFEYFKGSTWFLNMLFRALLLFACSHLIVGFLPMKHSRNLVKYMLFMLLMYYASKKYTSEFSSYFLLGYIAKEHGLVERLALLPCWGKQILVVVLLCIGVVGGGVLWQGKYDFYAYSVRDLISPGDFIFYLMRQFIADAWIFFFIVVIPIVSKHYTIFSYYGSKTLGIYLLHGFIILAVLKPNVSFTMYDGWYLWFGVLLLAIVLTMCCLWLIQLLERNKIMRMLMLGEK